MDWRKAPWAMIIVGVDILAAWAWVCKTAQAEPSYYCYMVLTRTRVSTGARGFRAELAVGACFF